MLRMCEYVYMLCRCVSERGDCAGTLVRLAQMRGRSDTRIYLHSVVMSNCVVDLYSHLGQMVFVPVSTVLHNFVPYTV